MNQSLWKTKKWPIANPDQIGNFLIHSEILRQETWSMKKQIRRKAVANRTWEHRCSLLSYFLPTSLLSTSSSLYPLISLVLPPLHRLLFLPWLERLTGEIGAAGMLVFLFLVIGTQNFPRFKTIVIELVLLCKNLVHIILRGLVLVIFLISKLDAAIELSMLIDCGLSS